MHGTSGFKGKPHWKVEKEMRLRKKLQPAGGYQGTGYSALGEATEKRLMLELSEAAQRGTPYSQQEQPEILRDTAVKLKRTSSVTGQLYTKDTNVAG